MSFRPSAKRESRNLGTAKSKIIATIVFDGFPAAFGSRSLGRDDSTLTTAWS
jgi:hypothetical protein